MGKRLDDNQVFHIKHWWNKFDTEIVNHGTTRELLGIELLDGFDAEHEAVKSAEEIMVDAVRHLSRPQMGQDNNKLAGRMQEWLTEFAE